MGVLGKILVFVNLVFSLLTAGLIIVVFSTRTNWKDANVKLTQNLEIVRAAAKAEVDAADDKVRQKDAQVQALEREKKLAEAAKAEMEVKLKKIADDAQAWERTHQGIQTNIDAVTQELTRRKAEVESLQKLLAERDKKIADIDSQMARLRDEKVQAEIQYKAAKEKIASLMTQIEATIRENGQLKAQLGNIQTAPTLSAKTPPPDDVRGTIKRVQGDLVTLSIGSDAGVSVNNVLQVYRQYPQPEYLGTVTILAVTPTESVGRLGGPKRTQVRVNDEVAAQLLPGR
jgi:myosin heavy subunit